MRMEPRSGGEATQEAEPETEEKLFAGDKPVSDRELGTAAMEGELG